ncbi:posphoenolpyruvate synthetase regulatory kinase/phosphorylase PpsR [Iodobacter fluviatilis]|jgi:regulator of PEP synthase PpsR (kinase-PPPase family)|uniref:Putative phosphoenolpyruvate synthase regulatory protein n=1 Tax=Iodobacter fluviatilis TaxID=537 RepID=A0A7G3GBW2_9NEIS|nr:pyruvate, water dikinase regulatory protein [Iodobacter fluviatilis]QBC45060.1 phosphoenolpyruvate synthase regulatory protein [Iodobacter fluviatilis]
MRRTAFFVSDRTGITAEMLGHSLLTQFEDVTFHRVTIPYVDTPEKAIEVALEIRKHSVIDGCRPLVFSTVVDPVIRKLTHVPEALVIDFFEMFIGPLEAELGQDSSHTVGKSHAIVNFEEYKNRIDAVNFTLNHDDGVMPRDLSEADLILVGVSRSGKTPTCLYLALQFGIKAANYPLTPEDFGNHTMPKLLLPYRNKLFGLTIESERLTEIREERKPDSKYSSIENCRFEIAEAEALMRHVGVPYLNTTRMSIEELATTIMHRTGLVRRTY